MKEEERMNEKDKEIDRNRFDFEYVMCDDFRMRTKHK